MAVPLYEYNPLTQRRFRRIVLPAVPASSAFELDLRSIMLRILDTAIGTHREELLKSAAESKETASNLNKPGANFSFGRTAAGFRMTLEALHNSSVGMVDKAIRLEEARETGKFVEVMKSRAGVDLRSVVNSEQVEPLVKAALQRNVSLIRGLSDDVAKRVEITLLQKITTGATNADTASALVEVAGFSRRRAAFIARDQAGSFNGELTKIRQQQAGVEEYIWDTSGDSRVRPEHRVRDEQTFRWDTPPSDGHPGTPVNCRCVARAVISFEDKSPGGGGEGAASQLYDKNYTPTTVEKVLGAQPTEVQSAIDAATNRLVGKPSTDSLVSQGGFMRPDGSWTDKRSTEVHDKAVREFFTPERISAATPKKGEAPALYLLGGRGGSGKSFLTGAGGPVDKTKTIVIDPDEFKRAIPEYQGWNAALVHEESSHITNLVINRARKLGLNVAIDATMASPKSPLKHIKAFKNEGYGVEGHYVFASPETAVRRALGRFMNGGSQGRYVPVEYILKSTGNERTFDSLTPEFKNWTVYSNNVDGQSPILEAKKRKVR